VSRPDAGFAVDTNAVTLITAETADALPLMSKREVAKRLLQWLEGL